ncbi:MAG: 4a-hydroxytetrahydrobiopterin dehydratase [Ilumatobacteraceae bacterium]|jgi:4a-hydroxytetrahydrobiopterin dehydratase|nr:4a-hydroxytetrahydrobiopterin dehydratase [Ilumatobacteraceae bacterium]
MDHTRVSPADLAAADGLDDWRFLLGGIHATFTTGSFTAAAELVSAFAAAAERAEHHPDIDLRYPGTLHVTLTTHAVGAVTTLDVDLARELSTLARAAGAGSQPLRAQRTEIAIDTMDLSRIRPFWQAVLGYVEAGDNVLVDPRRQDPPLWFQQMDEPRTQRNRFHVDVTVAHDEAEARIRAALAAGGRLVDDSHARSWWVLADADGNEVCVSTWQDR